MVIRIKKVYSETNHGLFRYVVSHELMIRDMIMKYELSCPDLYIDDVLVTRKATMGVRGFDGDYITSNNEVAGALTNQTFVLGHDVIFFQEKDEEGTQEVIKAVETFCARMNIAIEPMPTNLEM
jgi:hypothetical protein